MRRIAAILFLLTWVATPAFAWTHLAFVNGNLGGTTTTSPATAPAWSSAIPGMTMIMACADVTGGTLTPVSTSNPWTQLSCSGTALPTGAGTFEMNFWTRTVGTSEPATFGATFGDGGHSGCWIGYVQASDGTTPAIDACRIDYNSNTGIITNGSLSSTQNDDFTLGVTIGAWPLDGFSNAANPYATEWKDGISFINTSWSSGGLGTTGALPAVSYSTSNSGSGAITLATIAFKNNTTTAVNFIGRGKQVNPTGTPTSISLAVPNNTVVGHVQVAAVTQGGAGVGTLNLQQTSPVLASGSPNSASFTIPSTITAGMMAVGCAFAGGVPTAPSGWTQICTDNSHFGVECADKTLVGGDAGATATWGGSGINIIWAVLAKSGTLSVDGASACRNGGASASFTPTSITTGSANEYVLSFANQGGTGTATTPGYPAVDMGMRQNAVSSYIFEASAGAVPNQTFGSSDGGSAWEGAQIGIIGAPTPTTAWHSIGTATTVASDARIDAYWHLTGSYGEPAAWKFFFNGTSATAGGGIYELANVNTTTPFDVIKTEGDGVNSTPIYPSITPTSADEAIFGASTAGGGQNANATFWINMLSGLTGLGVQMNPLTLATGWPVTNQAPVVDGAQVVMGINAATAPTLGSSHICVNQAGYDLFANALITPAAGGQSVFGFVAQ